MEFMRKLAVMLVIFSLTGCSEEQTTEQQPPEKPSPTAEPATTDSAPPLEDPHPHPRGQEPSFPGPPEGPK